MLFNLRPSRRARPLDPHRSAPDDAPITPEPAPRTTACLDYSWIDRQPPSRPQGLSPGLEPIGAQDPSNPAGVIWSQGWSRTRLGRWSARATLALLTAGLVGTGADLLWNQFGRPYQLVTYRSVIGRLDRRDDQIKPVLVEVIDGFSRREDAERFRTSLSGALKDQGVTAGLGNAPTAISTRARLAPLCDREVVLCQFHDQADPPIQGEPQGPSRLDLPGLSSENLADRNGRHR